jgi:hypothetical protein
VLCGFSADGFMLNQLFCNPLDSFPSVLIEQMMLRFIQQSSFKPFDLPFPFVATSKHPTDEPKILRGTLMAVLSRDL